MPREPLGVKVLKAVSSPIRLRILDLLMNRGPLSYTEIMNLLKLKPSRDAGRFAYHLKTLLKMDLIEPDVEKKKYRLTGLGRKLVEVAEEIEESAFQRKRMLVRTSRLSLEYFERSKIAESLIKEAGVPADLAQSIAREAERRLTKLRTKYLTAPLIREFVNAILIERGLEEYRHKLTRLGLPVYDVTQLIKTMSLKAADVEAVHEAAGDAVLEEYALLNILPRDIADAHISGSLNINNLGCWILKPYGIMHDIRFFFKHGLSAGPSLVKASRKPPKSFESALSMTVEVLKLAARESIGEQTVDFFNVFLAPFVENMNRDEVREVIHNFLIEVNHIVSRGVSIGIELITPEFIAEAPAIGPNGKTFGSYRDFAGESLLIASSIIKAMLDEEKPLLNPSVIVKIRAEAFKDEGAQRTLMEAHRLALEKGTPYFANLVPKEQMYASYAATGFRLASEWSGDWELDTLRTGIMDSVIINLPRAYYDSGGDRGRFFEHLHDRMEMATRALEIKYLTIKQRAGERLLPFLTQCRNGDPYYRLENSSRLVGFVGLNEAVQSISGSPIHGSEESLKAAIEIVTFLSRELENYSKRPEARFNLSMVPCEGAARRLAELDIERYGLAKVRVRGGRRNPVYTDMTAVPAEAGIPLREYLRIEEQFHRLAPGSHLTPIPIHEKEDEPENLLSTTREIVNAHKIGLYTYSRDMTYCSNCDRLFYGEATKCPVCGSVKNMVRFVRKSAKYVTKPLNAL